MTNEVGEAAPLQGLARASMLRIAKRWQAQGQVNQAQAAFLRILAQYPNTPEAKQAAEQLMARAEQCERQGQFRLALSLYQKLEQHR